MAAYKHRLCVTGTLFCLMGTILWIAEPGDIADSLSHAGEAFQNDDAKPDTAVADTHGESEEPFCNSASCSVW